MLQLIKALVYLTIDDAQTIAELYKKLDLAKVEVFKYIEAEKKEKLEQEQAAEEFGPK